MHDIFFDLEELRLTAEEADKAEDMKSAWCFGFLLPKQDESPKSAGCVCVKCKEYCKFAEPNMEDGTFKCYSCKQYEQD